MPKGERKAAGAAATQQMGDVKTAFGDFISQAQEQLRGAQTQAGGALRVASPYSEQLAITGGISESEAQRMETTATRGVRSVYDVLGAEAKRRQAITGGYGGGGELSQMARQVGQREAEAVTGAQARIGEMRQAGRIAGAEQLIQLYGLTRDQANNVMDQILRAMIAGQQLTQGDIQIMAELSKQPGTFGAIAQGIGQIGGSIGSALTGLGGLGKLGGLFGGGKSGSPTNFAEPDWSAIYPGGDFKPPLMRNQ